MFKNKKYRAEIDYGDRVEDTQLLIPSDNNINPTLAFKKLGGPGTKVKKVRRL